MGAANSAQPAPPAPNAGIASPAAGGRISQADQALVGRYIAENDTKGAVKKAKAVHSQFGTAESEALLVEAYIARIRAMESSGMAVDAAALRELVTARYACAAQKLREMHTAPAAAAKDAIAAAGELARPDLPAQRRGEIEEAIRRDVTELPRLARCEALGADHPLRLAAGAICRAFQAVVTGPVDEEQTALREVAHRSPLADWKLLVRAIGCFYRREDDACRRLVEAMRGDSAAARLAPPLRAMLDGLAEERVSPQAAALVAAVVGGDRELHQALADLESAFRRKDHGKLKESIRRAVEQCRKARPELLDRLKQFISVRTFAVRCPPQVVIAAMGGPARHDSAFWALFARVVESTGDAPLACVIWEEFRRHAVHEGRFAPGGAETVALYLHMTDLLRKVSPDLLRRSQASIQRKLHSFAGMYEGQPPAIRAVAPDPKKAPDLYCLYPERVFERICGHVADAEVYSRWLEFASNDGQAKPTSEEVAERWHRAIPTDSRPLLFLMEQAERRKAFTKAMKYLGQAEALDGLSPAAKRARLRLWVANAVHHLEDGKPHLAARDFAALRELPQAREGDRPAMLAGLEWVGAMQAGDAAAAAARRADLAALFGGEEAAGVLLTCVGRAATKGAPLAPEGTAPATGQTLLRAVGRTCAACRDAGVPVTILPDWRRPLTETLAGADGSHDLAQIRALAEGALGVAQRDIAFAAAGAGLRVGGPHRARFLLLRARSLVQHGRRRQECLDVAAELARRQRDTDLLAEIMDEIGPWLAFNREGDISVADEAIDRVLSREAQAATPAEAERFAARGRKAGPGGRGRKAGGGRPAGLFDDLFDDDEDEDEDEDDDLFDDEDDFLDEDDSDEKMDSLPVDGLPPREIMELLVEVIGRTKGRLPSPDELGKIIRSDAKLNRRALELARKYGPPPGMEDVLGGILGLPGRPGRGAANERPDKRRKGRRRLW